MGSNPITSTRLVLSLGRRHGDADLGVRFEISAESVAQRPDRRTSSSTTLLLAALAKRAAAVRAVVREGCPPRSSPCTTGRAIWRRPIWRLPFTTTLRRAAKADVLSLTAFEVGLFGWMAVVFWVLFPDPHLEANQAAFWFLMQVGMAIGLLSSYPMNAFLVRRGVKAAM